MDQLSFLYPIADGIHQLFRLTDWNEQARYLFAKVDGETVSFRKDLMGYLAGSERLQVPFVSALPLPGPARPLVELHLDGFQKEERERIKQAIAEKGYTVYEAKDKPKPKSCAPGFLLRAGVTKNLAYYICASNNLRQATVLGLKARGVVVQGAEQFLALLDSGALPAQEPAWQLVRVPVELPGFDKQGHFADWAFLVGRWCFASLDLQAVRGANDRLIWTQTEVPRYGFTANDILQARDSSVTLQIESAVAGYHGWAVLKLYQGPQLRGRFRCKQYALFALLQDGDLSRLQAIHEEGEQPSVPPRLTWAGNCERLEVRLMKGGTMSLYAFPPLEEDGSLAFLRVFCSGLLADDLLNEDEVKVLHRWLQSYPQVQEDGLVRLLAEYLEVVLADGVITVAELIDVQDLVEALANGKTLDDMRDWRALAPVSGQEAPKVRRRNKNSSIRLLEGNQLDVIRFDYLNAKGELTQRRVVVRVVDDEYFKGFCVDRQASRTFRLDRIVGDVTSETSGEVCGVENWVSGLQVG